MKKVLAAVIFLFLTLCSQAQERLIPQKYIQDKEKPTLVMFTASWCPPCQYMKKTVMADPEVKDKLAGFNVLIMDVEQNDGKLFSGKFKAVGYKGSIPFFALLDKEGKVIDSVTGSRKKDAFLKFLLEAELPYN